MVQVGARTPVRPTQLSSLAFGLRYISHFKCDEALAFRLVIQRGRQTSPSLHLRHRLIRVRRVRHQSAVGAIGQQIELLQHGLADQVFVAEN